MKFQLWNIIAIKTDVDFVMCREFDFIKLLCKAATLFYTLRWKICLLWWQCLATLALDDERDVKKRRKNFSFSWLFFFFAHNLSGQINLQLPDKMATLFPVCMYKFHLTTNAVMMKKKKSVLRSLLIAFEHERKTQRASYCVVCMLAMSTRQQLFVIS